MNLIEKCWEAIVTWFKRVWRLLRLNWDLFGGIISGAVLSWLAEFDNNRISTIYAVIILMLVCIGLFKVLKNSLDKRMKRKKHQRFLAMVLLLYFFFLCFSLAHSGQPCPDVLLYIGAIHLCPQIEHIHHTFL